ncbi:hypothetical protein ACF0H5_016534 [Mactra antiquata]
MRCDTLLVPSHVTETVSVSSVPNYEERYGKTCVDFITMKRFNEQVNLKPCLTPVTYRDTVICFQDSNKRRFKSQTLYEPKIKPKKFSDTLIVFPKRPQKSYVTCLDYHIDECRRWFKTTMEFQAKVYTTRKIIKDDPDKARLEDSDCDNKALNESDGHGASQIFLPRWNKDKPFDENKNIPNIVNGDILVNGF